MGVFQCHEWQISVQVTNKGKRKQLDLPMQSELVAYTRGSLTPLMDFYLRDGWARRR